MKIFGMTAYTIRDRKTPYERDMALKGGNELFSDKIVSRYDLVDAMCDGVLPIPNYKSAYLRLNEEFIELESQLRKEANENNEKYLSIIKSCKHLIDKAPTTKDLIKDNLKSNDKCIYFCPLGDGDIITDDIVSGINDILKISDRVGNLASEVNKNTILFETTSDLGEYGKLSRDHFYNDTDFWNNNTSNALRIMFAKNQYNEGVHAPGVNKVFLARETESDIVFFEQIGRALSVQGNILKLTKKYETKTIDELQAIAKEQSIDISRCNSKEEIIERLLSPTIIDLVGNIEFIKELKDNLKERIKEREEKGIPTKINLKLVEASFNIDVKNEDLFEILHNLKKTINIAKERLIEEYIEMLKDDRIKKITSSDNITFNIDGKEVIRKSFWSNNSTKIKAKIQEEKYQIREYEKVRTKITEYEEKNKHLNSDIPLERLIEEYIEMLKDDRIEKITASDNITFNIDGKEVIRKNFWHFNSTKIKEKMKEEKYQTREYEKVRTKITEYEEKNSLFERLIEEYIEMLNNDEIKEIKTKATTTFNIDGKEVIRTNFWDFNSTKIKAKIQEEKYRTREYDNARYKIDRASNLRKNKESIEKLCNKYNINYKKNKKYIDKLPYKIFESILVYFIDNNIPYMNNDGLLVNDFYMSNKDFETKYGIGYIDLINKGKRL